MADLPAVSDLLSASFATADWCDLDKVNRDENGVLIGSVSEAQAANRPTAEFGNGVCAALRQASTFFRGTAEVTAFQVAEFLKLPRYTTAELTNGLAVTAGEGSLAYDTTLDRIKSSTGATWILYLASGDVQPGVHVFGEGGSIDDDFDTLDFEQDRFALTDNADGSVSIDIGQLQVSNLPAGVDRTLFTYATTAGPASTTTPTDILSQSIAGGTLSADGQQLHVELRGDDFNQSGVGITWEIAILLGGVEIYRDTTNSRASGTVRRPWKLEFSMTRLTSTTLHMSGQFRSSTAGGSPDTGIGDLTAAATMDAPLSSAASSPTVAWGSSQTLQVRITASTNGANTDFTRRSGHIKRCAA